MICYLCAEAVPDGEPYYNDHEKFVCKPCFGDSQRCFICRFPGRKLQPVPGLGLECEFCRGSLIEEGTEVSELLTAIGGYLKRFEMRPVLKPRMEWVDWRDLRDMQTDADLKPPEFIDDYMRYAYPVYFHDNAFYLLRRMTKETFMAYMVVQMAVADISDRYALPNLAARSPFHTFARGWCHWLGYEAAKLLGYDLERRQLRKWPELGGMGEFERWERMSKLNKTPKIIDFFKASLGPLARKHLTPGVGGGGKEAGARR